MASRDSQKSPTFAITPAANVDVEHGNRTSNHGRVTPQLEPPFAEHPAPIPKRHSFRVDDAMHEYGPDETSRWRAKIEEKLPEPVVRAGNRVVNWFKGPQPPSKYRITPYFERWQTVPVCLLARLPKWLRVALYGITCICWAVGFGVVVNDYSPPTNMGDAGAPIRLGCVDTLWSSAQACGLDGRNCLPFSNSTFAFNCPAACSNVEVLNPYPIGTTNIDYRSLVIGGTPDSSNDREYFYRGDSFICGAAIHAGVISNGKGGCGVLSLQGEADGFGSVSRHGIDSIGFDSSFPMSFVFKTNAAITKASSQCRDPRWNLLILSTIFTAIFGIFTTNGATFFPPVFTILFFQIGMASDPPAYTDYPSLASTAIGRFLPAALGAALFYQYSVRRTLRNCKASIEKTILWVGAAWVGALADFTLEKIPIQRLTAHDIKQQPGGVIALIIIVLVLAVIMVYQAYCFRKEGRLPFFLGLYAILGISLGILAAMPHLTLRIHHYVIALLLLPGTAMQTRVSLLCQGLLVGLYVNGTARWGFDAVLQTAAALRGDGQLGSAIPILVGDPVINASTITFTLKNVLKGYDGISLLVNDVERLRTGDVEDLQDSSSTSSSSTSSTSSSPSDRRNSTTTITWTRADDDSENKNPEYFRFGFIAYQPFGGISYSDFTRAGTWFPNGTWVKMEPGRT